MSDMVRPLGLQHGAHKDSLLVGWEGWLRAQHPLHRGRSQVKAGSAEKLRELHLAECRTQDPEPLNDVADEVWELVHRFLQRQKGIWSLCIEASHPGGNGVPRQVESLCDQPSRETSRRSMLKDCHSFGWTVVGSSPGMRATHAGILEAQLLGEEGELAPKLLDLGQQTCLERTALRRPSTDGDEGVPGEGTDLQDRLPDMTIPAPREGQYPAHSRLHEDIRVIYLRSW